MKEIHYFMVGMPSGGKTSYIVRLCNQLINESNMIYKLEDGELPDGLPYISKQMDEMNSAQNIMRTLENTHYNMTLPLVDEEGKKSLLTIPDLSGEHYRKLVEERYISRTISEGLQQADEILFFINTETMEKEERLNYNERSTASLIEETMQEEEKNEEQDEEQNKEEIPAVRVEVPEKATQSQVVELLQILLGMIKKKVRIKFVMSAWDRVEKKRPMGKIVPEEYLEAELPLLHQYIISNRDILDYEVFGVSAQGAEYSDSEEMKELEEENTEIDKLVKIVMPDGSEYLDISRLLKQE